MAPTPVRPLNLSKSASGFQCETVGYDKFLLMTQRYVLIKFVREIF